MQTSSAEIVRAFAQCATPTIEVIRAGIAAGIDWSAIELRIEAGLDPVSGGRRIYGPRLARIEVLPGHRFEFLDDGEEAPASRRSVGAMIFVAQSAAGVEEDLVAWTGRTDAATGRAEMPLRWLGVATMLGADNLVAYRRPGAGLWVHFDAKAYLRCGMRGVLVLTRGAADRLRYVDRLAVDSTTDGGVLERLLLEQRFMPDIEVEEAPGGAP